jgi:hypothetical protein
VRSRAGLEGRKISPPPGIDHRRVQPLTSRYTDWAILPEHFVRQIISCKWEGEDAGVSWPAGAGRGENGGWGGG